MLFLSLPLVPKRTAFLICEQSLDPLPCAALPGRPRFPITVGALIPRASSPPTQAPEVAGLRERLHLPGPVLRTARLYLAGDRSLCLNISYAGASILYESEYYSCDCAWSQANYTLLSLLSQAQSDCRRSSKESGPTD